jgi:nickel-type superoxide dismutase maturation protease
MPLPRGRRWRPLLVVFGAILALRLTRLARRSLDAVVVDGVSMAPALLPGDRLLVESVTLRWRPPRVGQIVLAPDPRAPQRELVKRVAEHDPVTDLVELRGDAPESSTDSRAFGAVPRAMIRWRVAARYWPPRRAGLL